jgi:hypothetical protein
MSFTTRCPKCHGTAWYRLDDNEVILKCLCGFYRVVASKYGDTLIEHIEPRSMVSLPKQGTKLWNCLMSLVTLKLATTHDITQSLNLRGGLQQTSSDVASQLTVLRYKGLVEVTENRKGCAGGSTWQCTGAAKAVLDL